MDDLFLREERSDDRAAVNALITRAFAPMPFRSGTEAAIAEALRRSGEMTLALVIERSATILAQAMFSPMTVDGQPSPWHALGPVAVDPSCQRSGLGSRLILEGLDQVRDSGAAGCAVLGDPAYYRRFGFQVTPELAPAGVPGEFFMTLPFNAARPRGRMAFHPAFEARA